VVTPNQIHFIEEKSLLHNQIFLQDLFVSGEMFTTRPKISECKRVTVTGCDKYLSFDKCKSCQEGHFLTVDYRCLPYPLDRIDNCQEYSSASICKKCINTFYLTGNKCHSSTVVPNCLVYDSFSDSCTECLEQFILSPTQDCLKRVYFPISNCKKLNIKEDKCEECHEGFKITNDEIGCFRLVINCETYHDVYASSSTKNACSICIEGFYPSDDGNKYN
jgi:hypothetical protein